MLHFQSYITRYVFDVRMLIFDFQFSLVGFRLSIFDFLSSIFYLRFSISMYLVIVSCCFQGSSDSCEPRDETALFNYMLANKLITLGWIHTHPKQVRKPAERPVVYCTVFGTVQQCMIWYATVQYGSVQYTTRYGGAIRYTVRYGDYLTASYTGRCTAWYGTWYGVQRGMVYCTTLQGTV